MPRRFQTFLDSPDCDMYALVFWGPNEDSYYNCIDIRTIPSHLLDGKKEGLINVRWTLGGAPYNKVYPFKGRVFATSGKLIRVNFS